VPELAGARSLLRAARDVFNTRIDETTPPLEAQRVPADPPRIAAAAPLEQGFFSRKVEGEARPAFRGFLDGVQESRVITWLPSGVPVVLVTVGAVALSRDDDRRLLASPAGARIRRALVLPRSLMDEETWNALTGVNVPLEDSGADGELRHPDTLLGSAVECADRMRSAEERAAAESWVRASNGLLAADGSLATLGSAARSSEVVGIVKSHRTLYVEATELPELFALEVGCRTRAFARGEARSWYLRLRETTRANPLQGMVRVEIAATPGDLSERADEVSRWVMAERTPIALPDARWDVMSYGIARCEAYLKRGLALRSSA
jgi:hypothetical protein